MGAGWVAAGAEQNRPGRPDACDRDGGGPRSGPRRRRHVGVSGTAALVIGLPPAGGL